MRKIFLLLTLFSVVRAQSQSLCNTSFEQELIQLINQGRIDKGLTSLEVSTALTMTANISVKEIIEESYINHTPDEFGYDGESDQIRFISKTTTPQSVYNGISFASSVTNYHKILFNLEKWSSYKWVSIGICYRQGNLSIFFGTTKDHDGFLETCSTEDFFIAPEVKKYPAIAMTLSKPCVITIFSYDENGQMNSFPFDEKMFNDHLNERVELELNSDGVTKYEVRIYEDPYAIVPQEMQVFMISASENFVHELTVVLKGNTLEEVIEFMEKGGDINLWGEVVPQKGSVLSRAVNRDALDIVRYLLEHGADINSQSDYHEVALCFVHSEAMFDLLMSHHPDLNLRDPDRFTLLHYFANNGLMKGVRYMIENKLCDVNQQAKSGITALSWAVVGHYYDVAAYLMSHGAKQNLFAFGVLPIHDAVAANDFRMVKLLVENGADVNASDQMGNNVLYYLDKDHDHQLIKDYLIGKGAK